MSKSTIAIAITLLQGLLLAQPSTSVSDHNANAWGMYFGDHKVSEKWGVHLEGQWRRANVGRNWQQLLVRPGVNYHVNKNLMLTVGYGYIRNYPYGEFPALTAFPEHRIYQQALVDRKSVV